MGFVVIHIRVALNILNRFIFVYVKRISLILFSKLGKIFGKIIKRNYFEFSLSQKDLPINKFSVEKIFKECLCLNFRKLSILNLERISYSLNVSLAYR